MIRQKYLLGIESTAHTFGIALIDVKTKKILCNLKEVFTTEEGGLIPNEVGKHHYEISEKLFEKALQETRVNKEDIISVAVSASPGLAPCLKAGMEFAKRICKGLKLPLVCVNHCIAHLEIGELTGAKNPVLLYTSGANTQIIAYEAGKYRIFGETLDLGVGNFIDTFARHAGFGFPGGPKIEELAKKGKRLIELPYSIKGMDVSFSGMQTQLKRFLDKGESLEDLCFSMQEYIFSMLVEAAERALAHTGKKELLLGGGVACNARLQEMCRIMCKERGAKYFCPERQFLVDNAGMIAYIGLKMFKKGIFYNFGDLDKADFDPRERTDDVSVEWVN
jgi:N6-L-threonylcarbamoyladenine synthase